MSDNPLETDFAHEERIRERAYHLWKADGCPEGSDLEFWERARELIAIEDSADAGQLPGNTDAGRWVDGHLVEEASLEENLGEFPDRLSDQGEHAATPRARNLRK
jgi:Protein of unknown function (DUF2934)